MKLSERTLNHIKSLTPEKAAEVYGCKVSTIKTALRTKKPSADMLTRYEDLEADGQIEGAPTPVVSREITLPPAAAAPATAGGAMSDEELQEFPTIQEIVAKMQELIDKQGQIIQALTNIGDRFENVDGRIEQLQSAAGAANENIQQLFNALQGNTASSTVPQPDIAIVQPLPNGSGGASDYLQPESISGVRPSGTAVRKPLFATGAPTTPAIVAPTVHPQLRQEPPAMPAAASPAGGGFNWLARHGEVNKK